MIFSRISLVEESEECHFPLHLYQQLTYDNQLFDMGKLYDIAAIYGPTNPETTRKLIAAVFTNDIRYVTDFKESIDTIITLLKKGFNSSLRVTEMIEGNALLDFPRQRQDEIIKRLMLNFCEILTNMELITMYFPDSMLETVRNTSLPLFMGNVYSLMIGPVKAWLKDSLIHEELEVIRKSLKKLAVESCLVILNRAIVKHIGLHVKNYAVVQDRLGQCLKQFLYGITGNIELSKEQLHRNLNFLTINNAGQTFLK